MECYRLCRRRHAAPDGEGARLAGGRWNSPGVAVVYASSTPALAALEYLTHVNPDQVPADLVLVTLSLDAPRHLPSVDLDALPSDWRLLPEHPACQAVGDAWAADPEGPAVLRVPSVHVPEEYNLLVNPRTASALSVAGQRRFAFDPRLLR